MIPGSPRWAVAVWALGTWPDGGWRLLPARYRTRWGASWGVTYLTPTLARGQRLKAIRVDMPMPAEPETAQ